MENFIGCLVSLDCGKTLGTYQGQIESIDAVQSTVTLVRLFRNGVPYQLPQVTIRSEDINDLKIIKYADLVNKESNEYSHSHASNLTSMLTATTSITTTIQISSEPAVAPIMAPVQPANSTKIDLPSMFSKTKYFQSLDAAKHDSYYSSMKAPAANKPYNKQHANISSDDFIHEQIFTNQSRRHKTSITPPNNFGRQHYCSELEDSFNNLNKTEDNQRQKMNKSFNPYHQFSLTSTKTTTQSGVTFTSSPNYNTQQQQQNPKMVSNYKGSTKDSHANRNQLLKISNSFTEPYGTHASMHSHKAHESSNQSPSRKPRNTPKRNNSDCFNNCDDNFKDDFDFEKNLALFDKAAVAMEINSAANSAQLTTTMAAAPSGHSNVKQQLLFNASLIPEREPKYKCDENILRGIKTSKRQIYFPDAQQSQPPKQFTYNSTLQQQKHNIQQQQLPVNHLILGEYKTDAELIVPGLSKNFRAKLFTTSSRWGFSLLRLVEAFGRGVCEAVIQYLGGCARFEEKNAHQRPTIVYLVGSRSWQSASALNSARHLANRSANVFVYETSPSLLTSSTATTSLGKKRPSQKRSNSTLTSTSSSTKKKNDSDDRGGGDDNDDDDGADEHDENEAMYAEELELFQMTSGLKIKNSVDFQKLGSVDLIISTLDIEANSDDNNTANLPSAAAATAAATTTSATTSFPSTTTKTASIINIIDITSKKLTLQQQQQLQVKQTNSYAIHWANSSKAPVFSIEPSAMLKETSVPYKRSFFCALPPWFDGLNVGQISLCDPGWPVKIFNEVGLAYNSPFQDKFFVSLHPV
ncbi:hypothetical protein HELRODRAFT_192269 [Helobdella robusta]|uniref:DFDF domain-containing protein n=1 Tax=Helobdella robusta TaxID=6412 RepID=T1FTS2_HELRO|nr:hypothetical protein HELRODRAFT_192269 [Helobdella robusta]ESO01247.1 hypothetical protein HELRODRAFT_192269 [Helobdella robusta]